MRRHIKLYKKNDARAHQIININIKLAITITGEARPDTFVLPYWKLLPRNYFGYPTVKSTIGSRYSAKFMALRSSS